MTTIKLIASKVFQMWEANREAMGDVPAKTFTAQHFGIKTKDVNDCIKYCQRGKIKVKSFSGKVTSKDCDLLWAEAVKAKAGYRCERSGQTTELQAHHIIPRTCWALRYDLENGICLTKSQHLFWAHHDGVAFAKWIETKRDLNYLESRRGNRSKHDYTAIALYLQDKIREFKNQKTVV